MSQEKVEKYKEYKKNRKEILAKEKRKKQIDRIIGWAVGIVLLGCIGAGIGVTVYNSHEKSLAARPTYETDQKMITDLTGILSTEADTE